MVSPSKKTPWGLSRLFVIGVVKVLVEVLVEAGSRSPAFESRLTSLTLVGILRTKDVNESRIIKKEPFENSKNRMVVLAAIVLQLDPLLSSPVNMVFISVDLMALISRILFCEFAPKGDTGPSLWATEAPSVSPLQPPMTLNRVAEIATKPNTFSFLLVMCFSLLPFLRLSTPMLGIGFFVALVDILPFFPANSGTWSFENSWSE